MAKDVKVERALDGTNWFGPSTWEDIQFLPNGLIRKFTDATDEYFTFGTDEAAWGLGGAWGGNALVPTAIAVKVSPVGVAWSATGGQGGRDVKISWGNGNYLMGSISLVHVDNVDYSVPGWVIVTVGDHSVGYTSRGISQIEENQTP